MFFYLENGFDLYYAISTIITYGAFGSKKNKLLKNVKTKIENGIDFSDALANTKLFSNDILVLLEIAINNGGIKNTCKTISNIYKQKKEKQNSMIIRLSEPVMIFIAACYVIYILQIAVIPKLTSIGGIF